MIKEEMIRKRLMYLEMKDDELKKEYVLFSLENLKARRRIIKRIISLHENLKKCQ